MAIGLGRPTLLPLYVQHCLRRSLALAHRPALQQARVAKPLLLATGLTREFASPVSTSFTFTVEHEWKWKDLAHCSEVEVATLPDTVLLRLGFPDEACHTEVFHDARCAHHDRRIATHLRMKTGYYLMLDLLHTAVLLMMHHSAQCFQEVGAPKKLRSATGMRKAAACF